MSIINVTTRSELQVKPNAACILKASYSALLPYIVEIINLVRLRSVNEKL